MKCKFCEVVRRELYKCPRCSIDYCSVKCYRNEQHSKCTESFYQDCVKTELEGKRHSGDKPVDSFEELMTKYVKGEVDEMPGFSGEKVEEGEPLEVEPDGEEDEQDENYIKKVIEGAMDDYVLDDDELERKLLGMGLGTDTEQLLATLNDEEKAAFAQLAEELYQQEHGLGQSCFRNPS